MSLLDRLRDAQDEPARRRASPYAGPSILTVGQLRAMERALAREGFFDREPVERVEPVEPVPALVPVPRLVAVAPVAEPLPVWTPPPEVEPLPVWRPPVWAPVPNPFDPCANCGEEVTIDRIDLTADATWITCRACGLRWNGPIDESSAQNSGKSGKSGGRGNIVAF